MTKVSNSRPTLRTDAAEVLEQCLGVRSRMLARRISQFMDRELEETGFSLAQVGLLAHVASAKDDRLGALAERMGLDPSTLTRNLQAFERAGLVEIASVEFDQRRRAVWLTEAGARRLQSALPVWRAAQEKLAGNVAESLASELVAAVRAVT